MQRHGEKEHTPRPSFWNNDVGPRKIPQKGSRPLFDKLTTQKSYKYLINWDIFLNLARKNLIQPPREHNK